MLASPRSSFSSPFSLPRFFHHITRTKYIDDEYIQKRCITCITCELGEDMVDSAKGSGKRTRMNS